VCEGEGDGRNIKRQASHLQRLISGRQALAEG
jgi:hypothetical protein